MSDASQIRNVLMILEDAEYMGPKSSDTVSYAATVTKGQISKIVANLKSYDSARYTKLGRNLLKIEELTAEMKALRDDVKQDTRELIADLFHAEDAVATRVVETVSFTFHMSKDPKPTETYKYAAILEELETHLTPELISVLETLKAKHKSPPVQKAAALKATDKAATQESLNEGMLDKLKDFFSRLRDWVMNWASGYDARLDALKAKAGLVENIQEDWAEEREAFWMEIAKAMGEDLDDDLIDAIESSAVTPEEWKQNRLACMQRIRGAQEEMYDFDLGESSIADEEDDGWYAHQELWGKISREDWKKGWRYNHSKPLPFYHTPTKTWHDKIEESTDEVDYEKLRREMEKDRELKDRFGTGYFYSPKGAGYLQGYDHEVSGNVILLVDRGQGVRSKDDDSKEMVSVPFNTLKVWKDGDFVPVEGSLEEGASRSFASAAKKYQASVERSIRKAARDYNRLGGERALPNILITHDLKQSHADQIRDHAAKISRKKVTEEFSIGDIVCVTNPRATPRYEIVDKSETHYTVQSRETGKSMDLPKDRIHRVNAQAKELVGENAPVEEAKKAEWKLNSIGDKALKTRGYEGNYSYNERTERYDWAVLAPDGTILNSGSTPSYSEMDSKVRSTIDQHCSNIKESSDQPKFPVGSVVKINSPRSSLHNEYGTVEAVYQAPEDEGGDVYKVVAYGMGYWAEYDEHELEAGSHDQAHDFYRQPPESIREGEDCEHNWVEGIDDDGELEEPPYDVCTNCGEVRY